MTNPASMWQVLSSDEQFDELADKEAILDFTERQTVAELREVARLNGWSLQGRSREEIMEGIHQAYRSPEDLAGAIAGLDPPARMVLGLVALAGPEDESVLPHTLAELVQSMEISGLPTDSDAMEAILGELRQRGLVLDFGGLQEWVPYESLAWLLPVDAVTPGVDPGGWRIDPPIDPLAMLLRAWSCLSRIEPIVQAWPWPDGVSWSEPTLHPDRRWPSSSGDRSVRSVPIVPAGAWLEDHARAALEQALGLGEPAAPAFYASMLIYAGCLEADESDRELLVTRPEVIERICGSGYEGFMSGWIQAWLELRYGIWDPISEALVAGELNAFRRSAYPQPVPNDFNHLLRFHAHSLVESLRGMPGEGLGDEGWVDFDRFLALEGIVDRHRFIPEMDYSGFGLAPAGRQQVQGSEDPGAWSEVGSVLLRRLILGPLRWLGLVQLARDAEGRPRAIRRTELAARCMLVRFEKRPPPKLEIEWGQDRSMCTLPVGLDALDGLAALSGIGRLELIDSGSRIRVHLGPDTVCKVLESGESMEALIDRLQGMGIVDAGLRERIEDWAGAWGRVNLLTGAAMIELADRSVARSLLAVTGIRERIVYRVSETRWLVEEDDVARLIEELESVGHRPRVLDEGVLEDGHKGRRA